MEDSYWEWKRRNGDTVLDCEICGGPFEGEGDGLFQFACPDCQDESDSEAAVQVIETKRSVSKKHTHNFKRSLDPHYERCTCGVIQAITAGK